jgi:hypothetical protein
MLAVLNTGGNYKTLDESLVQHIEQPIIDLHASRRRVITLRLADYIMQLKSYLYSNTI